MHVIPTISWCDERTFDFAFDGIGSGGVVAVSTIGTNGNEETFVQGYMKMIEIVKPNAVLMYGTEKYADLAKSTGIDTYIFKSNFQNRRSYGNKIV